MKKTTRLVLQSAAHKNSPLTEDARSLNTFSLSELRCKERGPAASIAQLQEIPSRALWLSWALCPAWRSRFGFALLGRRIEGLGPRQRLGVSDDRLARLGGALDVRTLQELSPGSCVTSTGTSLGRKSKPLGGRITSMGNNSRLPTCRRPCRQMLSRSPGHKTRRKKPALLQSFACTSSGMA